MYKKLTIPRKVLNANDEQIIIDKVATIDFHFLNMPDVTLKTEFMILNKMPIECNIGLNFSHANKHVVDFEKQTIKLNNYTLSYAQEHSKDTDREISNLIHSKNITIIEKNRIAELIFEKKQVAPDIGCIPEIEHKISLLNETPIISKEYPLPIGLRETVRAELKKMTYNKIIRIIKLEYSSSAFPIKKKDGSIRMLVDYLKLNSITREMVYPFPDLRYQLLELN